MYNNNSTEIAFVAAYNKNFHPDITTLIKHPTPDEDMYEHWDIEMDGKKFDIKGLKKKNRSDKHTDPEVIWVELRNVRGNIGWLYGKADYIVFEQEDYFAIISREVLKWEVESKLIRSFSDLKKPYWIYRRKNRLDELTLVPYSDIKHLVEHKLQKA